MEATIDKDTPRNYIKTKFKDMIGETGNKLPKLSLTTLISLYLNNHQTVTLEEITKFIYELPDNKDMQERIKRTVISELNRGARRGLWTKLDTHLFSKV